jgi:arsenate reductase
MKKVLVLCTGNSCRSQIAEGYLKHFGKNRIEVYSAGIETHGVNPRAVKIMSEDNIDISKQTSNNINEYRDVEFDFIITVCDHARENCPYFPSKAVRFHKNFEDPAKANGSELEIMNAFRDVREQIKEYCEQLISQQILN